MNAQTLNQQFPLPCLSHWSIGQNDFPIATIKNRYGTAKVSLYGGHLLTWQPHNSHPVIWLSERAIYQEGKAIRGGIPIIFPHFGAHPTDDSQPSHGVARTSWWKPIAAGSLPNGATFLQMGLTTPTFQLDVTYTIGWTLTTTLKATNVSDDPFSFSSALHTYFVVGDAEKATISGLDGVSYQDKVKGGSHQQDGSIQFGEEVDRVYVDTAAPVTIHDPIFNRTLTISKFNSNTTVVWNPSPTTQKADLSANAWRQFVCVEALKYGRDAVTLQPSEQQIYTQDVSVSG